MLVSILYAIWIVYTASTLFVLLLLAGVILHNKKAYKQHQKNLTNMLTTGKNQLDDPW